jgi:hypothetical protein
MRLNAVIMQRARGIALLCLAPFLAGCAIHPLPEDVTRKTTHSIVEQVRCEAKRAVLDHGAGLGNASIAYDFEFNINEHNDASGGITFTNPFKAGGSFGLTASAGADRTREAVRNFKIVDSFDELQQAKCTQEALEKNWIYPMAGDIGMYEAVATFAKLQKIEHPAAGKLFTFADTLNFTTTFHGDINSTVTLSPVTDRFRVTEGNLSLVNSRKDFHKVIVSMVAGPQVLARRQSRSGRSGGARFSTFGVVPGNGLLSTTLVQQASDSEDRALYELDRQRTLEFQRRAINVLIGP